MEEVDFGRIVVIISVFISLFLAGFLFSVKSKNKISNLLFAVFLILFAIDRGSAITRFFWEEKLSAFTNLKYLSPAIQIPVFYLYFLSICYSDFKLQKKHLLHLLLYIGLNVMFLPKFYACNVIDRIAFINNSKYSYEVIMTHVFIGLQMLIYLVLCFFILKKAKKIFVENYSSNSIKAYNWLLQLLLSYSAFFVFAMVKNILKYSNYNTQYNTAQILLSTYILIAICWYVLKALRNPELFKGVNSKTVLVERLIRENTNKERVDKEIKELNVYMITHEPYLNPSLTIRNLAEQMKFPMRDLSVLINQSLNKHFFDFVNEYRIKKAMSILKNPSNYKMTILEILYEVGFNSKSSFNTAFKKHTQLTPTQFRKKELES